MAHAKSELGPTMTDYEKALRIVEAEMVAKLGPAHDMAALDGPRCGCGEPSKLDATYPLTGDRAHWNE